MKKRYIVGAIATPMVLLAMAGAGSSKTPVKNSSIIAASTSAPTAQSIKVSATSETPVTTKPICNGTTITSSCTVDGVSYKTYVYHPAVQEKSHSEDVTTYEKVVSGYCTLCDDGTYSPSCATGKGACSHHGGVAQWNAPRYTTKPVTTTKTVIDAVAQTAYFDKVTE